MVKIVATSLLIKGDKMDIELTKKFCKNWIDANVHDGYDRSGSDCDRVSFTPDELQELIDDMVTDLLTKKEK